MLNTQDQQDLVSHAVYGPLIRRVSKQETFRSNALYGFRIVTHDDVIQDVIIQLINTGIGVAALGGMTAPEGWLRITARWMCQNAIDKRIGSKKDTLGRRRGRIDFLDNTTDFTADYEKHTALWSADLGEPEDFVDQDAFAELLDKTGETIRGIVDKVQDRDQREALIGFYLRGDTQTSATLRKRRSRGRSQLTTEDVASLQAWRAFHYPEAKRPPKVDAPPALLREPSQAGPLRVVQFGYDI